MCDHKTGDSSKTSERSEGNTTVCKKIKRNRSDQNGKPEGQSRSKFRIGNSGAAALSESGTLRDNRPGIKKSPNFADEQY